ncbi:MAG: hypothetical protein JSS76_04275 [Bacteroidetes bacterium]|nr:hypothetical protein [Bacteroidota bacterium]MBS1683945.1 hypothetical protein [Bacteroidota bacterium]
MSVARFCLRSVIVATIAILLATTCTVSTGCAANKCDCPKFGGHRLKH